MQFSGNRGPGALRSGGVQSRVAQRIPRRAANRHRKISRLLWRVHLEVHAQRLRLQHPGKHTDLLPDAWNNSKIPGFAGRVSVPNIHGFTALMVFSSVAARFFPPQIGGLGVTVGQSGGPSASITMRSSTRQLTCSIKPWTRGALGRLQLEI